MQFKYPRKRNLDLVSWKSVSLLFCYYCLSVKFFLPPPANKMSWDSYIDNLIAQSKDASGTLHADRACIIGMDGGASWTSAAHASALKVRGWTRVYNIIGIGGSCAWSILSMSS